MKPTERLGNPSLARRQFLRATVLGGASLAGWSVLSGGLPGQARAAASAGSGGTTGASARVIPFGTGWLFGPADGGGEEPVTLPHTVAELSWRNWDPDSWQRQWAYRKNFTVPAAASGARVFLDVAAALTSLTPVLNGHQLPGHAGGYLPASIELTDYLTSGPNDLSLTLDSRFNLDVPPDRPAPYDPRSVDYWQPGGIYREVTLRIVPQVFVSDVFARPSNVLDAASRRLDVDYTLDAAVVPSGPVTVTADLLDGSSVVASASAPVTISAAGTVTGTVALTQLADITLWDTQNPKLYTVSVTLKVNGIPLHDYRVRTGFREARFTTGGFFLNGSRLKLIGLCRHQFFPFAGGAQPARVQRKDAEILRTELNCNAVRCSHYPQSEDFLDACDELGILVWQEIPGWGYFGDAAWQQAAYNDLHDMIIRDRNRPSIAVWGAMPNEAGEHVAEYTGYNDLAHSLDPTRPTGGDGANNDASFVFDVFSYHDYSSRTGPDGLRQALLSQPVDAAGKPYLICEAIGTLSGPALAYRRTDPQQLQQGLATAHAGILNTAFSDDRYCGLISWAGFDYLSDATGNCLQGVKYVGVTDLFRALKPGAAIYAAQADPASRPVIEPAFYWHFGASYPVTILPAAMICSNLDRLEVYVGGAHFATLTPDTGSYPHLPHAPSFADFTSVNGASRPELRIDGYRGGDLAVSRRFSADTSKDRLAVTADDPALTADGVDATRVEFRAVDEFGNSRPYVTGDVTLSVNGPGILVGESPFAFADTGGVGAVWIRTRPGASGPITVRASHPSLGSAAVTIKATAPAGTGTTAASAGIGAAVPAGTAVSGTGVSGTVVEAAAPGKTYPSLAAAFDNVGITADGATAAGNLDGGGSSYSAAALAAAGLTPGAAITTPDGLSYTWPDVSPGQPDNALGSGQTVAVDGKAGATRLGLLASCTSGGGFGTLIVRYADGTSEYTLGYLSAWTAGAASGGPGQEYTVAATAAYYNTASGGPVQTATYVYAVTVPVDPARRVVAVTLPNRSSTVNTLVNAAHIFAITTGTPATYDSLAAAFNNKGISDDFDVSAANFDGTGNSYSRQALAAAGLTPGGGITHDGLAFTWPDAAAGAPDNVLALGQTVRVSGSGSSGRTGTRLGFLGAASPGNLLGTGTVHYADGSASQYTFTLDNYFGPPGASNTAVASLTYLNDSNPASNGGTAGKRTQANYVYYASVPIVPGRPVTAVTLPPNGANPASGRTQALHIFALSIG